MLTTAKKTKLFNNIKAYSKKYLNKITELDESGTRLMVNDFLSEVLGFIPIEEIKTEYMIRGTYADYVIQYKTERQFLVEVKALSFALSEKHLRQAINYGANEGIEWAMLTNGRNFQFYKILFNKPIESRKIFEFDLSDMAQCKESVESLQFLTKDAMANKGLVSLWSKTSALDPANVASLLFTPTVINFVKRTLKGKFKSKFSEDEITGSLKRIIHERIAFENLRLEKPRKKKLPKTKAVAIAAAEQEIPETDSSVKAEGA